VLAALCQHLLAKARERELRAELVRREQSGRQKTGNGTVPAQATLFTSRLQEGITLEGLKSTDAENDRGGVSGLDLSCVIEWEDPVPK
jgi:hypothetical protein